MYTLFPEYVVLIDTKTYSLNAREKKGAITYLNIMFYNKRRSLIVPSI